MEPHVAENMLDHANMQNLTASLQDLISHESMHTRLAIRRLSEDPHLQSLTEEQKAAFLLGYGAGMEEGVIYLGVFAMAALCALCAAVPMLHLPLRQRLRPWAQNYVDSGREWVVLIQKFQSPIFDHIHTVTAATCGVDFYLLFIPFLFWCGELHLARELVNVMSLSIYIGNGCKDLICSARPDWTRGVRLVGGKSGDAKGFGIDDEYGIPSSHTTCTITLLAFVIHFYNYHRGGEARWLHQNMIHANFQMIVVGSILWTLLVIHGRLYLGMHSPIDIVGGFFVAAIVLLFYIPLEDFIDAFETNYRYAPVLQIVISILQLFAYPTPDHYTPSYSYAVYFIGAVLGVTVAVWRRPDLHSIDAMIAIEKLRGPLASWYSIFWCLRRFVVGALVVLVARAVGKIVFRFLFLRVIFPLLRIPVSDHDDFYLRGPGHEHTVKKWKTKSHKEQQKNDKPIPVGFNQNTAVRICNYSLVGWAVAEFAFHVFGALGI